MVAAVLLAAERAPLPFAAYNVATGDYITVREIAELAIEVVGIAPGLTTMVFSGGERGWKGDVPIVRLSTERIRRLGWVNRLDTRQALRASLEAMIVDNRAGRFV